MKTVDMNVRSIKVPYLVSLSNRVRYSVLALISIFVLLPALTQADGLFDFQMTLAQKGNVEAQFKVGEMYETGFGVKQDMTEASNWINKAASQGHETAKLKLMYWDIEKNGITASNKAEFEAMKTKAEAEDPQAQYYLGKMYGRGVGVEKDSNAAISLLNKAAFVGVLEAEREVVTVREDKQRQIIAKRRADEKRNAELRAQQEQDRLEKREAQRQLQAQKQAEAKARADELAMKNKAANEAANEAAIKASSNAAENAKAKAATATATAEKQAEDRRLEAQKQALLKKRAQDEEARKTQFESDPCSGKSARFLSTCK